jgi:hypothetical protein
MTRPTFDLPPFVGVHMPEATSNEFTLEISILCPYCRESRAAHKIDGGWWHHVARGGDLGQYDPCLAGQLRNGLERYKSQTNE